MTIEQKIKRWMFYNCPKKHSWIVYQNIRSILEGTNFKVAPGHRATVPIPVPQIIKVREINPETKEEVDVDYPSHIEPDQICYVHSVVANPNGLTCLLETENGFYLIENQKIVINKKNKETKENQTEKDQKAEEESAEDEEHDEEAVEDEVSGEEALEDEVSDEEAAEDEEEDARGEIIDIEEDKDEDTNANKIVFDSEVVDEEEEKKKAPEIEIKSNLTFYDSLNHFVQKASKTVIKTLGIKRLHGIKLNKEQKEQRRYLPCDYYHLLKNGQQIEELLNQELADSGEKKLLDLSFNYIVTADHLENWTPSGEVQKILFNTCFQINKFSWAGAEWTKNVKSLELINIPQVTNQNIEYLVVKIENLEELMIHYCPQINIRVILGAMKPNKLKVICLNDAGLPVQPNQYAGLITDAEWELFRNYSVEQLLINSGNLSLDVIDYLKISCCHLKTLIISDQKYQELRQNMVPGLKKDDQFLICAMSGRKMQVERDFMIRNLLKSRYQDPYSDSMKRIMEQVYGDSTNGDSTDEDKPKSVIMCHVK